MIIICYIYILLHSFLSSFTYIVLYEPHHSLVNIFTDALFYSLLSYSLVLNYFPYSYAWLAMESFNQTNK